MGLDPVVVLILPHVLALVCALPILTFIGSMAALYGGGWQHVSCASRWWQLALWRRYGLPSVRGQRPEHSNKGERKSKKRKGEI
jgi:hypothetical protein